MASSQSPRSSHAQQSPTEWTGTDNHEHEHDQRYQLQEPLDYVHSLSQRGLYTIPADEDVPLHVPGESSSSSRSESSSYNPSWPGPSFQSPLHSLPLSPNLASLPYEDDQAMLHGGATPVHPVYYSSLDYLSHRTLPQIHVDTSAIDTVSSTHRNYDPHTPYEMRSNVLHGGPSMTYSSSPSTSSLPPLTPVTSPIGSTSSPFLNASPVSPSSNAVVHGYDNQLLSYDPRGETGLHRTVAEIATAYATPYDGVLVPQKTYRPHTQSDRRRYVEEVDLEQPIMFYVQNPVGCGIPLRDALNSKFMRLAGRDDLMFVNRGPSVSIRLMWPGYAPWSRQIPTRDFRTPPGPITRAKLAKNVAKTVQRFIDDMEGRRLEDEAEARWRVGKNHIQLDNLVLVGLQHVSMGSWQAYVRYIHRP